MLEQLLKTDILVKGPLSAEGTAYKLSDREAYLIDKKKGVSIGIVLSLPLKMDSMWLNRLTLVLALYPESADCALHYRGKRWLLWQYYEEEDDREKIVEKMLFQLALARFIESKYTQ